MNKPRKNISAHSDIFYVDYDTANRFIYENTK